MPVFVSMLRAVNVGGHGKISMEALRDLYESLGLRDAQTHIQSGNVIFKTSQRNPSHLAERIAGAIQDRFGFRPAVVVRSCSDLRQTVARNPFPKQAAAQPAKLLVVFLSARPDPEACDKAHGIKVGPEELRIVGRELYIYFPDGQGRSKLSLPFVEKTLKTTGTGRNWNTVTQLLNMAERLEAS